MSKIVGLGLTAVLVLNAAMASKQQFANYRKIEAYEVRSGLLMMPRYTASDEICEIGLERLLYSPEMIRLDSSLSHPEIDQILDELVPADSRGKSLKSAADGLITQSGNSLTTSMDFENVLIEIYAATASSKRRSEITASEVVATVKWKKRTCR